MLLGICGLKQHGKTTVANFLVEHFNFRVLSFADGVRDMAEAIDPFVRVYSDGEEVYARYTDVLRNRGYEWAKMQPDVRRLLQRIGTEAGRRVVGDDVWVQALAKKLDAAGRCHVVVPDVRFPNEAECILDRGGMLWRVVRTGVDDVQDTHESERHVRHLVVHHELVASNVAELHHAVSELMAVPHPHEVHRMDDEGGMLYGRQN